MYSTEKRAIKYLISAHRGIPLTAAEDLIDEVQNLISEFPYTENSPYTSQEEILSQYLGLTSDYLYIFA